MTTTRDSLAPELRSESRTNGVRRNDRARGIGAKVETTIPSGAVHGFGVAQPTGDRTGHFRLNAIGYLRVSTDQQAESGLGLEAQRASITAAAERLGLQLQFVLVDAAVSGSLSISARPVLVQAVSSLGRGDVLLVAKRDRLGRDMIDVAMIERLVVKRGARIISAAGEGTDDDAPSSKLLRHLVDSFAEYERLVISARTRAALAAKRARGERTGTLPFGSQLAPDSKQLLAPAPVEQRLLARMREMRDDGFATRKIAEALNAEGATTRRGTAWRFQYVARVLRREQEAC